MRQFSAKGYPVAGAVMVAFVAGLLLGGVLRPPEGRGIEPVRVARAEPRSAPVTGSITGREYPADVLRVTDGDTFEARVRVWPGLDITTKVRLRGIDAPELRARCDEEVAKAEAARGALAALLAEGDIRVSNVGLDKYGGRVLADAATRRTADVSRAMLSAGHARAYSGGRRESWCGRG